MSLKSNNLISTAKRQYFYKLQGYEHFFIIIFALQAIGMVFSITGMGGRTSTSSDLYTLRVLQSTTIQIFLFTAAIVIAASISLNLKEAKIMDFTFVSNRLSSNISNIAFLGTLALTSSVTFGLSGLFVRTVRYLAVGSSEIIEKGFFITPGELVFSIAAAFLYLMLFSSLAYFFTVLVQRSRAFVLLELSLIVLLPRIPLFGKIVDFFKNENDLGIFTLKVVFVSTFLFLFSALTSNSMEVRK